MIPKNSGEEPFILAGRYQVEATLGQGGIAKVFRAIDLHGDRAVALKLMFPNLRSQPEVVTRFRREITVVGRVNHPHVVPIWNVHESPNHLFLVMPLMGEDLSAHLSAKAPLTLASWLRLALDLCAALQAAHEAGVVHRDLKPQNVLRIPASADPEPRFALCDFGLARTLDTAGLTSARTLLGTPAYMAPEVAREGHADPRSDIYSLCVLVFESLTGRLPFSGNTPFAVLHQHLTATPPSPSGLRPEVPEPLARALLQGLEKDPTDRPGSAAALAAALEAGFAPSNPLARAPSPTARLVPADHAVCPSCGHAFVRVVGVCTRCGHQGLGATVNAGSYVVAIDGLYVEPTPHALDTQTHARWLKALEQVVVDREVLGRLRKDTVHAPLVLAQGLDRASADLLVHAALRAGLHAETITKRQWLLRPFRTWRGKLSAVAFASSSVALLMTGVSLHLGIILLILGGSLVSQYRPKISFKRKQRKQEPARELALLASQLKRANERRLGGRIAELCFLMSNAVGEEGGAAILSRAKPAIEALARLDESDEAWREVSTDAEEAQDRLRESERLRLLTLNDLLQVLGRLEAMAARLAAPRDDNPEAGARWQAQLAELRLHSDAMDEVRAWCERK